MFTGEIRRARSKRPLVIGLLFPGVVALEKGANVKKDAKLRAVVKVPTGEKTSKGMAVELDNAKGEFKLGTSGDAVLEGEQRPLLAGMM
jgi:hypothetical protein